MNMVSLRKILVVSAFLSLVSTAAYAQGPWTGVFAGATFGLARQSDPIHLAGLNGLDEFIAGDGIPETIAGGAKGILFGGQAGFNWQSGKLVAGAEGDYSFVMIDRVEDVTRPYGVDRYTHGETHVDRLMTFRGRIGVAQPRALLYATAGLGFANASSSIMVTTTTKNDVPGCLIANVGICVADGVAQWVHGFVYGGGVELGGPVTFKGEVLFYDFGDLVTRAHRFDRGQHRRKRGERRAGRYRNGSWSD